MRRFADLEMPLAELTLCARSRHSYPRWKTFATIAHASYANLWSNENRALVIFEKSL